MKPKNQVDFQNDENSANNGDAMTAKLGAHGGKVYGEAVDATDGDALRKFAANAIDALGGVEFVAERNRLSGHLARQILRGALIALAAPRVLRPQPRNGHGRQQSEPDPTASAHAGCQTRFSASAGGPPL